MLLRQGIQAAPDLTEQVYKRLLGAICGGELAPGTRLRQEDLAASLSVSRQPVLQALHLLKRDGIVIESGRRGLAVAPLQPALIGQIYQVRAALDGLAAREAATRKAKLDRSIIERGREAARSGRVAAMIEVDAAFTIFYGRGQPADRREHAPPLAPHPARDGRDRAGRRCARAGVGRAPGDPRRHQRRGRRTRRAPCARTLRGRRPFLGPALGSAGAQSIRRSTEEATVTQSSSGSSITTAISSSRASSAAEIKALTDEVPALFAQRRPENVREKDRDAVRTNFAAHMYNPLYARLGRHPRMIEPVRQLFGEDVYMHQFKINGKVAFDGDLWQWHQDYGTWQVDDQMPVPRAMNIAIFLNEVNEFNGPLMFIPGSHKLGVVEAAHDTSTTSYPLWTINHDTIRKLVEHGGLVAPKGPAGSMIMFHGCLVHASTANLSPWDRWNVYLSLCGLQPHPQVRGRPISPTATSRRSPACRTTACCATIRSSAGKDGTPEEACSRCRCGIAPPTTGQPARARAGPVPPALLT
jgi:ectoine hydroxylase